MDSEKENIVGKSLYAFRKLSKYKSQSELGKLCGAVINTIGAYERGDRLPDMEFIMKFAAVLNLSDEELFGLIRLRMIACKGFGESLEHNTSKIDQILSHANERTIEMPINVATQDSQKAINDSQGNYVAKLISMNSLLVKVEGMKVANTSSTMSGRMPIHTKNNFDAIAIMIEQLNLEDK